MTTLTKLTILFDTHLLEYNKEFISLRIANKLIQETNDPELQRIDLKKMLESGILPYAQQTPTPPRQWRIFRSDHTVAEAPPQPSGTVAPVYNPISYDAGTDTFTDARTITKKHPYNYLVLAVVIVGCFLFLINEFKDDKDEPAPKTSSYVSAKNYHATQQIGSNTDEYDDALGKTEILLEDLITFKDDPAFHYYGFGGGGPYKEWLNAARELARSPAGKEILLTRGFALGDLQMLGLEYMKSTGNETEYSRWARSRITEGLQ